MRIDTALLLVLMILKMVSVVPLAYKQFGADVGVSVLLAVVFGYAMLIYFCETEQRTSSSRSELVH